MHSSSSAAVAARKAVTWSCTDHFV